ncbi:MAG: thymidine phosphorylase [bacterium]|nr:thymidine phosphorylase [bacterium]
MQVVELIARKQAGGELTDAEIDSLIRQFAVGEVPDYQMSALLMAGYFQGFSEREGLRFLDAMIRSGERWSFADIPAPKVDKHSTGGVGDKTSLIIAPVVAEAGLCVPMISGRALGHTGGTLDKLESIRGLRVTLARDELARVLRDHGCAFGAQTSELVPADKRLYALRDVTATVAIPPLIAASILSKKIAEGTDALAMDVKLGPGGFLRSDSEARELGQRIVNWSREYGVRTVVFGTDMHQPLGATAGNALEVSECLDVLRTGRGERRLLELCTLLGGAMLWLGGLSASHAAGMTAFTRILETGRGYDRFRRIAEAQGADPAIWREGEQANPCKNLFEIRAEQDGFINEVHPREVGMALVELGAGRKSAADAIDPSAGVLFAKHRGDKVTRGEVLATLQWSRSVEASSAQSRIARAFDIAPAVPAARPLHYFTIE